MFLSAALIIHLCICKINFALDQTVLNCASPLQNSFRLDQQVTPHYLSDEPGTGKFSCHVKWQPHIKFAMLYQREKLTARDSSANKYSTTSIYTFERLSKGIYFTMAQSI